MSSAVEFRYLSQADVVACGGDDMRLVLDVLERVLREHAAGRVMAPPKSVMRWGNERTESTTGRFNSMPGYVGGEFEIAGIKWIASMPSNPAKRGLPRGMGLTILNDPSSGAPLAVVEGTLISAMRTGGVCGVAASRLAIPGAATAALVGAGVISQVTARALTVALPGIRALRVFDLDRERAEDFAERASARTGVPCAALDSAAAAAESADIVVSATTAHDPIVDLAMLAPSALYCQIGANECATDVIEAASKVVVDDWQQVIHRGTQTVAKMHARGEFPERRLHGELGAVLSGEIAGREPDDGIIVVSAIGLGIEDLAIARILLEEAEQRGVGRVLPLWESPFAA